MIPVVGFSCQTTRSGSRRTEPDASTGKITLRTEYLAPLEKSAFCLLIPPRKDLRSVGRLLNRLDGLVLTGGDDLHPAFYGEKLDPRTIPCPKERTATELRLIREALKADIPVLAICLGMQVLNVALGGSLVQHLQSSSIHKRKVSDGRVHRIRIVPATLLETILGGGTLRVNSTHHQAVSKLGRGLVPSAHSAEGVIEGIELPGKRFVVGVQWHPERMPSAVSSRRLYRAFLEACRRKKLAGE